MQNNFDCKDVPAKKDDKLWKQNNPSDKQKLEEKPSIFKQTWVHFSEIPVFPGAQRKFEI